MRFVESGALRFRTISRRCGEQMLLEPGCQRIDAQAVRLIELDEDAAAHGTDLTALDKVQCSETLLQERCDGRRDAGCAVAAAPRQGRYESKGRHSPQGRRLRLGGRPAAPPHGSTAG